MNASRWLALVLAPAVLAAPLAAQGRPAKVDSSAWASLAWRELGPLRGGRSVAVAGSQARPQEYWMGTTGGGVFKTTDGGLTWAPASDRYFGGTIGAIGVAESNPDVVYVGTGEFPIRGNVSHGDGVFKTTDGGRTWQYVGLVETRQISRVRVHPRNPDVAWVGAQGNVWVPTPDRGVYKTTDGGKSWRKVLFRNDSTGVSDLALDPANPNVLYAAFWQSGRTPWQLVSGGKGSGLFKSTDGGETWVELTGNTGLPKGLWGNVGVTVSPANPKRLWALIEADSGGVYRSDDAGETWTRVNDERKLRQRAWYYTKIYADTKDTNIVYASNVSFQRSTDGGRTWSNIRTPHGDSHDLWIAPENNQRMIEGNDGGANVSLNAGRSWTGQEYATAQMYHVITTNHFPYRVCGAQQDNSTICLPSRKEGGVTMRDASWPAGGESGYLAFRPDNPDISYGGSYGGFLTRVDMATGLERNIMPWPLNPMGHSAGDLKYRFQWTYPIVVSPHDPNTLYVTGNVVFRTRDEGQTWQVISGDLTRNDPATLGPSGGPITKDQTSVEYYGTIFAFAESPRERGVLWAGSDDGLVHVSRDGGATWANVTPPDMAKYTRVSIIDPSPHAGGTAYVAANRYQLGDMRPYVWKTTDYGKSWTRLDAGLPRGEFTRVVREDPVRPGLLVAGTERGVHVSLDDGGTWHSLRRNLPIVPVHDLVIKDGDIVLGTHGRSFWIMDDITPLRQASAELVQKELALLAPRPAHRINWGGGFGGGGRAGQNPPSGAVIHYWLKSAPDSVVLEFLDAKGTVLRRISSELDSAGRADSLRRAARRDSVTSRGVEPAALPPDFGTDPAAPPAFGPPRAPKKRGMNSFAWNLRAEDAATFKGMILWAGGTQGPVVPPGSYRVRITAGGRSETQPLTVLKDPRSTATQADLDEQYAFLLEIRDRTSAANNAVRTIRNVKAQLADRAAKLPAGRRAAFRRTADAYAARLSAVEEQIYQVKNRSGQDPLNYPIRLNNEISALAGVVASTEAKPTQASRDVFALLRDRLQAQLDRLAPLLERDLAPINAELQRAGLERIVPSTAELAGADDAADDDTAMEEEEGETPRRW